jgi:EAL domain-containing protein (putative c-di-GMP-specific phosphodiesterase class I)
MSTTAEGIETEAQLDVVRAEGCTEVQGFLFSPPLPRAAIDGLFAQPRGMEECLRTLRKIA